MSCHEVDADELPLLKNNILFLTLVYQLLDHSLNGSDGFEYTEQVTAPSPLVDFEWNGAAVRFINYHYI